MDLDELVASKIRQLLKNRGEEPSFKTDEALIGGGRLDSLAVVELISHFETALRVRFSPDNFSPSDFESHKTMVQLLQRLSSGKS